MNIFLSILLLTLTASATPRVITVDLFKSGDQSKTWTLPSISDQFCGIADTQALTNKTIDGVAPGTFTFLDATSSIQTQLNAKQATLSSSPAIAHQFLTEYLAPNTYTHAQPAFTDISGQAVLAQIPSFQVNKVFYVDGARSDAYTADGSLARPFKTISASIAQIIANADNATSVYNVFVTPTTYFESLTFNNALLRNINFVVLGGGPGGTGLATVDNSAGNVLISTASNTGLGTLTFNGFIFNGGINFSGDVNATNFCGSQCVFTNCSHETGTNGITLFDVNNVSWYNSQLHGTTAYTFTNVAFAYIQGAEGLKSGTTVNLIENGGLNEPAQTTGNYLLLSETKTSAHMSVDAGSELDAIQTYFSSSSTLTNNGILHSFASTYNGANTWNNGSTNRLRGDTFLNQPTLGATATVTNQTDEYLLGLVMGQKVTPAVPATAGEKLYFKSDDKLYSLNHAGVESLISSGGTVTSASVVSANGFAGTVATSTTTPAITISTSVNGIAKGNGTALSAATAGTDYSAGTSGNATGIVKSTTGTGALTTAIAADFPTLNQNTTGNAATVTTNANLTGPVTSVGNATSVTNNAITNAMLAQMATNTIKGNNTGGTANALDLTVAQVNTMLGDVTSISIASANGFAGSSSGGATPALTISTSVNGLVKGNGTALSAAASGTDYQAPVSTSAAVSNQFVTGFTAPNTFTRAQPAFPDISGTATVAQVTVATQAVGASAIDWSTGSLFTKTLGANTTFTFSNKTSGQTIVVRLTNTASNYTVTWPTVKWSGGSAPVQTIGAKSDVYTFVYDGTDIYGSAVQNF